jgi:hypothetical protein
MTPRTWPTWAGKLRARALENWPIKLTALILAAILWAAVAAQEPTTQVVPVRLDVLPPSGRTLAGELPTVHAVYRGSARELIKLYGRSPLIRRTLPDTVTGSTYILELSLADLHAADAGNVTAVDLEPRAVIVQLDSLSRRVVPVAARVTVEVDSGFLQFGPVRVAPRQVIVRGPRDAVERVDSVRTVPLRLTRVNAPVRRTVALDTAIAPGVSVSQREVDVTVDVGAIAEKVLQGIPIEVIGGHDYEADPPAVIVTVRGRASRLPLLTRDSVRVIARVLGTDARQQVVLEVVAPEGTSGWATPDSAVARRGPIP